MWRTFVVKLLLLKLGNSAILFGQQLVRMFRELLENRHEDISPIDLEKTTDLMLPKPLQLHVEQFPVALDLEERVVKRV